MSDDHTTAHLQDDERINFGRIWEVIQWARQLGVSIGRLHQIIREVGPVVKDVKREIVVQEKRPGPRAH